MSSHTACIFLHFIPAADIVLGKIPLDILNVKLLLQQQDCRKIKTSIWEDMNDTSETS